MPALAGFFIIILKWVLKFKNLCAIIQLRRNFMATGHDLLNKRIQTKLIQWCIDNNKMIYDIPRMDGGKKNPLYDFMFNLKKNIKYITKENIELLNQYGMVWSDSTDTKTHQAHITKRIKSELIPWCKTNNKMIYDIPRKNENGDLNTLYVFCTYLKKKLKFLPEETVALLKKYGMITEECLVKKTYVRAVTRRIKSDLIPWCIENNKLICEIPRLDENGNKPHLYDFVYWLRKHAEYLTEDNIELLNKYGMEWTVSKKKSLDKRAYKYLISWYNKTGILLRDMPYKDENGYPYTEYMFRNFLKQHKDELLPETIEELNKCGMDWTIRKRKKSNHSTDNNNTNSNDDGTTV